MTKYTVASSRRPMNEKPQIAPIWRGVGCLMIVVIPALSYALAYLTVQLILQLNWPMPYQLMGNPVMPPWLMQNSALFPIGRFIEGQVNLYAILMLAILYIVVLGGLLSTIYTFVYRYVGPPRYGPLDAPPSSQKVKRYKR
jgi:hypothetical protein